MLAAVVLVAAFVGSFAGSAVYNKLTRDPIWVTYRCSCGKVNMRWSFKQRCACRNCGLTYSFQPLGKRVTA